MKLIVIVAVMLGLGLPVSSFAKEEEDTGALVRSLTSSMETALSEELKGLAKADENKAAVAASLYILIQDMDKVSPGTLEVLKYLLEKKHASGVSN